MPTVKLPSHKNSSLSLPRTVDGVGGSIHFNAAGLAEVTDDQADELLRLYPTAERHPDSPLWGLFEGPAGQVGVKYLTANDTYQILIPIGEGRYWRRDYRTSGSNPNVHAPYAGGVVTVDGATLTEEVQLAPGFSAETIAIRYYKTGDSTPGDWMGETHTNHAETSFVVKVDGEEVSMGNGEILWGDVITMEMVSELYDPADGVTKAADLETEWTVTYRGIRIAWDLTWRLAGTVNTGYAGMATLEETFTRTSFDTASEDYDISDGGGGSVHLAEAEIGYIWLPGEPYACALRLPNPAVGVDNWAASDPVYAMVIPSASNRKIYFTRVGGSISETAVAVDEVWRSIVEHRIRYFPYDADKALAR